jgi:hypothetical protein
MSDLLAFAVNISGIKFDESGVKWPLICVERMPQQTDTLFVRCFSPPSFFALLVLAVSF